MTNKLRFPHQTHLLPKAGAGDPKAGVGDPKAGAGDPKLGELPNPVLWEAKDPKVGELAFAKLK